MSVRSILRWAGSIIGIGGVALCITIVSQGMRSVEKIGGACQSGAQSSVTAHACPAAVPGLLTGGIFAGLAFLALFVVCVGERGRPVVLLAWPALFLTLGWNFLDSGLHPATGGTSVGFLVCAVTFIAMGGLPLLYIIPQLFQALRGRDDSTSTSTPRPFASTRVQFSQPTPWSGMTTPPTMTPTAWPVVTPAPPTAPPAASSPSATGDVAADLERLASLHARGELSDTEYDEAKRKTLETPRST
jgi:hypothetical protein